MGETPKSHLFKNTLFTTLKAGFLNGALFGVSPKGDSPRKRAVVRCQPHRIKSKRKQISKIKTNKHSP